jgi:hypothetical protein
MACPGGSLVPGVPALNRLIRDAARRFAARAGFDTVESGYNSPIPDYHALDADTWKRAAPMPGVNLRGEVVPLPLEAIPTVAPGVVIQIHDVFRPYEYPERLVKEHGVVWQEHYLVQAFLAFNPEFEVLLANYALLRGERGRIEALMPSVRDVDVLSEQPLAAPGRPQLTVGRREVPGPNPGSPMRKARLRGPVSFLGR